MKVNQIYSILNNVAQQTNGQIALASYDNTGLVAMGDTVLSSSETKDVFTKVLMDVITKVILSTRKYAGENYVLTEYFAYSATLQKIYVDPMEARENPEYELVDGESIDQYIVRKPTVRQKIFSNKNTFEIDITIPDDSLSTAFHSPEEMAAFIDSIMQAVENTLEVEMENMQLMAIDNMIGEVVHNNKSSQVIKLLTEYNTLHGSAITKETALTDVEFLKYSTKRINETRKRMKKMSVLFNSEGWHRHTPTEDLRILVLDSYNDSVTSYLQADTYHNEMVALKDGYKTLPYWQAPGTDYDFDTVSKIQLTTSSGNEVEQGDIIAMMFDRDAIFATYNMERTESVRNARGRYQNYFFKGTKMYANDMSENCVVFMVA